MALIEDNLVGKGTMVTTLFLLAYVVVAFTTIVTDSDKGMEITKNLGTIVAMFATVWATGKALVKLGG